jgi:hypothetical protein
MAGRPTKLTPEVQKKIVDAIRAGNYMETAAAYAGISKDTFYRWLRRGARARNGIYKNFHDAVEKALAESEVRDVMIIANAAATDWKAAAWRLERKFPERWGKKTQYYDNEEERFLKLEQLRLAIEKTKAEIKEIEKKHAPPEPPNIEVYLDAVKGRAAEVWDDDDEE